MSVNVTVRLLGLVLLSSYGFQCTNGKGSTEKTEVSEGKVSKLGASNPSEQGLNAFMDVSHKNASVDLETAKKAGLVGFFHKATQGTGFVDDKYGERVKQGRELDLLIGAYHFGTAQPVEAQVDSFLAVLNRYDSKGVVPVLDWEDNPVTEEGIMSKEQAQQFITLFQQKTGVYPMIYGGYWMLYQLRDEQDIELFSKTPLWQGFYSATFGYLDGIWKDWTFLQYTDGKLGPEPHTFDGVGNVDRSVFNGQLSDVLNFWQQNALKGQSRAK